MISYESFNKQIRALGEILRDESNYRVEKQWILRNIQCKLKEYRGDNYIIIQQVLNKKTTGSIFVNFVTISYHKSYQEPVIYFKCGDYTTNEEALAIDPQPVKMEFGESIEDSSDEDFALGMVDFTEIKYEWDIDKIIQSKLFPLQSAVSVPTSLPWNSFAGNISLDYHNVLTNEPWFFIHPCQTNVILNLNDENDYLLNWMSIYGKYLNISLNSRVVVCKIEKTNAEKTSN